MGLGLPRLESTTQSIASFEIARAQDDNPRIREASNSAGNVSVFGGLWKIHGSFTKLKYSCNLSPLSFI
jgi:hypothetical protein